MQRLLLICLLSISLVTHAQRYTAYIETPKACVSGICMLETEGDVTRGAFFNEFGVTALDFTYSLSKDKVRLHSVMPALDKWYIRRVLRRDLRQLMHRLKEGDGNYINERYHITYSLTPLEDEAPNTSDHDSEE